MSRFLDVGRLMLFLAATPVLAHADPALVLRSIGPKHLYLRLEAVNDDVVRAWYSNSDQFSRKTSQALEHAPSSRLAIHAVDEGPNFRVRTKNLILLIDRASLAITVLDAMTKSPVVNSIGISKIEGDGRWTLSQGLFKEEHLLGLGEDNRNHGKLDRRGTIRELWAGQQIKSGNVTAEYPIPFMLSTGPKGHAYGVFFDDVYRLRYDLAKTDPNRIQLEAAGGDADFYVINGPAPKGVISRYTEMTGRPSLPPLWALGYIQSRCVFYNWSDVDAAYNGLRSRGYPLDALVIDYSWPEVMNDFVWDKRWTVDGVPPGRRVADYRKKGVSFMMSISGPMLQKSSPTYGPGWAAGVFATDGDGHPVQAGYYGGDLLDYTSPNMDAWLWPQVRPRNLEGVNGWWLDLTEPEGEPPQTVYKAGKSADIHNQYSMLVTRCFEGSQLQDHPNDRPFILTRAGSAGIQSHHAVLWTGDINSDYPTLAAHPGEMLNSGISGINGWTCDTGGFLTGYYKNDQYGAHARLYERWMQFSVFSPVTRAHKAGLCMPYEFGPATEQGTKKYLNLRYRLLPYIYSHAVEASQTGVPLVRAMGIEFPNDPGSIEAKGDQYMFGKNLLVAPVLNEGVANRSVYFPPGKWIDWDYGYQYSGGKTWVVKAPQNRIPVAVRPGAIIPMAPDMANTTVGKWDPITLEIFPSGASSFTMTQDDGRTFNYRKGQNTTTQFTSEESLERVQFSLAQSNRLFVPHQYDFHFHLDRRPLTVKIDGAVPIWHWDPNVRILSTSLRTGRELRHTVVVQLSSSQLPARLAPSLVADKIDSKGEVPGGGKPIPHFFPGPVLPAKVLAADYDNGGEGVAYHVAKPISSRLYRSDNVGIGLGKAGKGYEVTGLSRDDWLRYSVDSGNGGFFDLVIRAEGEGGLRLLSSDRNVIPPLHFARHEGIQDLVIPNIYLNPGSDSLMLYVDQPGFGLQSLEFRPAANPPSVYEAEWAARSGQVVVQGPGGGANGSLGNVGQLSGSVTMGVKAASEGINRVRIRYANGGKELTFRLAVSGGEPFLVKFPNTGGGASWKDLDVSVPFRSGANRISLSWQTNGYDSLQIDRFEVLGPQ